MELNVYISPRHTLRDWNNSPTLGTKIDIFEARVADWTLAVAQRLVDTDRAAGFATLAIVASYFEMIIQYRDGAPGKGASKATFQKGIAWVFPSLSMYGDHAAREIADAVYDEVRNGLYHDGATRSKVRISNSFACPLAGVMRGHPKTITLGSSVEIAIPSTQDSVATVDVNPRQFVAALSNHFSSYLAELRDPANDELRANFERRFMA